MRYGFRAQKRPLFVIFHLLYSVKLMQRRNQIFYTPRFEAKLSLIVTFFLFCGSSISMGNINILNRLKDSILFVIIFFLLQPVLAQKKNIKKNRQDLERIRSEIELYKSKIKSESAKEKNVLDVLSGLDKEVDLTHALVDQLKQEDQKKSKAILNVQHVLMDKQDELERIGKIYKKRLVFFYKHGRIKDIELLLSAKSFNQVLLWIKYQSLLAANDRRNYQNILDKKHVVEDKKSKLKTEILSKRKIINEKTEEEENLKKRKVEREKYLVRVRQNKQLYLQKLTEYRISAKEIERLISTREERRIAKGEFRDTNFPQLKGRMIWPAHGKIITKFGRYKHPQLKTITESIGIDIKADYGAEVNVVGSGVITAITWQRGRGNIVIVSHFGGYYTVYTHLSRIFVQIDDEVKIGQVIGEVGDSGSLKGPMLHFEIWQNNKVVNPEKWLS